jgi:hypothetical protein
MIMFYSNDLYGLEAFDVGDAELSRSEQNLFESFDLLVSIPARNVLPSIGRDQSRRVSQSRKKKYDDKCCFTGTTTLGITSASITTLSIMGLFATLSITVSSVIIIVSNLLVKQWCVSEQFIVINDNMKMVARDFISNGRWGEESKTAERQRECIWDRAWQRDRDSVGNKIDR